MTDTLETPSGKGAGDENFPVGSFLIRPDLRRHVHVFYRFARAGDDIADNPDLEPEDKAARLARMAEIILGAPGAESPSAVGMRLSLEETGIEPSTLELEIIETGEEDNDNWVEIRFGEIDPAIAPLR